MRKPLAIENARDEELERALRLLHRGVDPAHVAEQMSLRLVNKLIHIPTRHLRLADATHPELATLLATYLPAR